MKNLTSLSVAALVLLTACRATRGEKRVGAPALGLASEQQDEPEPPVESFPAATPATAPTNESASTPDAVLAAGPHVALADGSIWRDPAFRRRFTESYLAVSDIEPSVTTDERDILRDVGEYLAEDRLDKATQLLRKEGGPQASAVLDFTLGNIYFQGDKLQEAQVAYRTAAEKFPRFRRAWKNHGLVLFRLGDPGAASESLTHVIELGGGDSLTYGLLGFSYSALEKPVAAESAYRMAMLFDPDMLDWRLGLARTFFQQNRYADAASLCGELIAEQPESADLWMLQANAYVGLGENLKAAQNFEFVDRLGGSSAASLNNLADIYINEELYDLAVATYTRAMEREPDASATRSLRAAKTLIAHGAFEDVNVLIAAIRSNQGERLDPADQVALLKLEARVAVAEGRPGDESQVLEEIVKLDPLDGEALILLGQHAGREGDLERGVFYFERAANIEGFELQAKRRHGQLLVSHERYAEALPFLRRVQSLEPRDVLEAYIEQVERLSKSGAGKRQAGGL